MVRQKLRKKGINKRGRRRSRRRRRDEEENNEDDGRGIIDERPIG